MGAVAVALAVGVVLVDDDLLAGLEQARRGQHRSGEDALPRLVGEHQLERVGALGRRVLGVRMVDVVPGAVGQDRVDEVRLDLGRLGAGTPLTPGVDTGRLVLEVPADLVVLDVAVDEHRGRQDGVRIGRAAQHDAVLGLDATHLGDGHAGSAYRRPQAR